MFAKKDYIHLNIYSNQVKTFIPVTIRKKDNIFEKPFIFFKWYTLHLQNVLNLEQRVLFTHGL